MRQQECTILFFLQCPHAKCIETEKKIPFYIYIMCCGGDLILTLMVDEIGTQKEELKKKVSQVDRPHRKKKKDSLILIPYASAGALEGGDEGCELLKC